MQAPPPSDLRVEPLRPEHAPALARLFEIAGSDCFCRYWHFPGDKNDWQLRLALEPEKNRAELERAIAQRTPEAMGVVAVDDAAGIVGWLKIAPGTALRKIYDQKLYKGLACLEHDRQGVLTVGCLLVAPSHRRRGIARKLLEGAVAFAAQNGARAIEAFPRRHAGASDEHLWTGPMEIYEALGFKVLSDLVPYPVMRLDLEHQPPQPLP